MVWNDELKREIPEGREVKTLWDIILENPKSQIKVWDIEWVWEYPFFTSWEEILLTDNFQVDWLNCFMNTWWNWDIKYYNWKCSYSTDTWCIKWKWHTTTYLSQILLSFKPWLDIKFFAWTWLQHLQKDLLKKEKIVLPPDEILLKFDDIVNNITKKISNTKRENQKLSEIRDFLLPMLMNGQIAVS